MKWKKNSALKPDVATLELVIYGMFRAVRSSVWFAKHREDF